VTTKPFVIGVLKFITSNILSYILPNILCHYSVTLSNKSHTQSNTKIQLDNTVLKTMIILLSVTTLCF